MAPDTIDRDVWNTKRSMNQTWVAINDTQLTGFIDLLPKGYIDMLYVNPDFYRRGIATTLIKKVFEETRRQNIKRLTTESSITALPFFKAMGFSIIESQTVLYNGQNFINYQLEKIR